MKKNSRKKKSKAILPIFKACKKKCTKNKSLKKSAKKSAVSKVTANGQFDFLSSSITGVLVLTAYWSALSKVSIASLINGVFISIISILFANIFLKIVAAEKNHKNIYAILKIKYSITSMPLFILYLLKSMLISSLSVARRIMSTEPINLTPEVGYITPIKKDNFDIALLSGAITITPGTLTISETNNNTLIVHALSLEELESVTTDTNPAVAKALGN